MTERVPLVATELDGLAAGAGAVWVTAPQDGLLWRITPDATRSIDVGAGARGVAVAGGSVWVANAARGTVTRIDPRSNRVDAVIRVGNAPRALASDGGGSGSASPPAAAARLRATPRVRRAAPSRRPPAAESSRVPARRSA